MLEVGIPWSDYAAMPEHVAERLYEVLRERHHQAKAEGAASASPRVTRRMR